MGCKTAPTCLVVPEVEETKKKRPNKSASVHHSQTQLFNASKTHFNKASTKTKKKMDRHTWESAASKINPLFSLCFQLLHNRNTSKCSQQSAKNQQHKPQNWPNVSDKKKMNMYIYTLSASAASTCISYVVYLIMYSRTPLIHSSFKCLPMHNVFGISSQQRMSRNIYVI